MEANAFIGSHLRGPRNHQEITVTKEQKAQAAQALKNFNARVAQKAGREAIANGVALGTASDGIAKVVLGYVKAFAKEDAALLLNSVREGIIAKRRKASGTLWDDTRDMPAAVNPQRISEMRGILRLSAWTCHAGVFETLMQLNAPMDTIVGVSNYIRNNVKPGDVGPSRAKIVAVINERKAARNGKGKKSRRKARAPNIVMVCGRIAKAAGTLAKFYPQRDAASFISAMVKACKSLAPIAIKIEAAKAKAREEGNGK